MNSTSRRGEGGLTMAVASYVKGALLSEGKPLVCAAA